MVACCANAEAEEHPDQLLIAPRVDATDHGVLDFGERMALAAEDDVRLVQLDERNERLEQRRVEVAVGIDEAEVTAATLGQADPECLALAKVRGEHNARDDFRFQALDRPLAPVRRSVGNGDHLEGDVGVSKDTHQLHNVRP